MYHSPKAGSRLTFLSCSACGKQYDAHHLNTFATCCIKPLLVNYDLRGAPGRHILAGRPGNMWRYREFLPVINEANIVSLGEGFTPVMQVTKAAAEYGLTQVFLKDEAYNPTGSFKARGLSMAISKAKELGVVACIVPTAGNAGGALSAYCAKAGMKATVIMPAITPQIFADECVLHGADVLLLDGLINECGKKAGEISRETGAFDISTLKEPYRIEGKKTMGYEIAEQFNWELPEVIIYPAGGGTGLIGIWKAFIEMKEMGWITGPLPRMIAVQSGNCQPVVKAFDDKRGVSNSYSGPAASVANGLAVPYPFGLDLMLKVLEESGGMALSVTEEEIVAGVREMAIREGLLLCPEGAAVWKAMIKLKGSGILQGAEKVLLINTGSGYKYLDQVMRQ
ncbi:threonine synthase [Hufsiella ginkgonis]|uniref:Threonine synthase n=1 Tax=Hufsiella ginkgonis TaxID=2695274 RepID=A0A7K1XTB4_9SPHI|nr:threonine synthase [Hufsiella ginkgonis]MXV14251.1 threonine synthase [Hufsiella ginkgonis]